MKYQLYILLILLSGFSYGQQISSVATGNWESSGSWSLGRVPLSGDTITVTAGRTITITSQCVIAPNPVIIHIYGTLNFQTGKKLVLACGSVIYIYEGGQVTAGGGGGMNNYIEICSEVVWKAADGNLSGPLTLRPAVLPVNLLNFEAVPDNFIVSLNWSTASELNNDYFIIEKTLNGNDFSEVAKVDGSGNSNKVLNYSAKDNTPYNGQSYYRLRQTDYDGKTTAYDLVPVNFNTTSREVAIYPNPVDRNENINLVLGDVAEKEILITVVDMLGNEAYSKIIFPENNQQNSFVIDIQHRLAPGVYMITGSSDNNILSKKIVVR